MNSRSAFARMRSLVLTAALLNAAGCIQTPPIPDMRGATMVSGAASVTVPFVFDNNRVFVPVALTAPDGTVHKTLAFVNMGSGAFVLANKLYRELGISDGSKLSMAIGAMQIAVDPRVVQPEDQVNSISIRINPFHKPLTSAEIARRPGGSMAQLSAPMDVEAVIPPGLLQNFQVVFDYGAKTITLAPPGTLKPDGIAVPFRLNAKTGFATLDLTIDGRRTLMVIDDGGSYSAVLGSVASEWLATHPSWLRSEGGVGESNLIMDGGIDVGAPVLKIPNATLGPLKLDELGVMSPTIGGVLGGFVTHTFIDYYSEKAGEEVNGWIGGNVLKSFRLTLEYSNCVSYWLQETPIDTHDLDQVGITLAHSGNMTTVAGIAKKNGVATVSSVMAGDQIVSIGGRPTAAMTRGELLDALHGTPGEHRHLVLKRNGKLVEVDTVVTAF